MELILAITTFLLFALLLAKEFIHSKQLQRKDDLIKDLTIKIMSKDANEYRHATEAPVVPPENAEEEEDELIPIEEVPLKKLREAKDLL